MATDIHAKMRYVSSSAQKVRLVLDMVRNRSANDALNLLRYTPKEAARIVHKLLTSACRMRKRILASAGIIFMFIRFLRMKLPHGSGDVLVPAGVSNPCFAAIRILQ
jgi:hypothetical protein